MGLLMHNENEVLPVYLDGVKLLSHYRLERLYGKQYEMWRIEIHDLDTPDAIVASVIRKPGSYGYEYGLYELAFMKHGQLLGTFEADWGDQVLGYLSEEEVERWIRRMLHELGDL
jgi:hypothetical protein